MSVSPIERLGIDFVLTAAHASEAHRWGELRAMGVTRDTGERMANLTIRQVLALARSRRLLSGMKFNPAAVESVITHAEREQRLDAVAKALLRHEAPLPMMSALFGLAANGCAEMRRSTGVASSSGRPRILTDKEETNAWQAWKDSGDLESLPDRYLQVARVTGVPLAPLWPILRGWTIDAGIPILGDGKDIA